MAEAHNDQGPTLLIVIWLFTGLCLMTVLTRLVARRINKALGLDDIIICIALFINLAVAIDATVAIHYGFGQHYSTLSPDDAYDCLIATTLLHSLLLLSFAVPKISIVALLHRLFPIPLWQSVLTFGMAIGLTIGSTIVAVFHWTQCMPVEHQWDKSVPGTCWPPHVISDLSIWLGSCSAFLDLFYAVFPAIVVSGLNWGTGKKISVSVLLGLGIIACGITAYKTSKVPELQANDVTYSSWPLVLWTDIEANILIIAASIPTLGPVARPMGKTLRRYGSELVHSMHTSSKDSAGHGRVVKGRQVDIEADGSEENRQRNERKKKSHASLLETTTTRSLSVSVSRAEVGGSTNMEDTNEGTLSSRIGLGRGRGLTSWIFKARAVEDKRRRRAEMGDTGLTLSLGSGVPVGGPAAGGQRTVDVATLGSEGVGGGGNDAEERRMTEGGLRLSRIVSGQQIELPVTHTDKGGDMNQEVQESALMIGRAPITGRNEEQRTARNDENTHTAVTGHIGGGWNRHGIGVAM